MAIPQIYPAQLQGHLKAMGDGERKERERERERDIQTQTPKSKKLEKRHITSYL